MDASNILKKEVVLTKEGRKKLEAELDELKNVRRKEIAERLKDAVDYGDLNENSEYDDAKNEQAFVEYRIEQIETILLKAKTIDRKHVTTKEVGIGSLVEIEQIRGNKKKQYSVRIVGPAEASLENHMISFESPVGSALMGLKVDESVQVQTPSGKVRFKVLSISK